MIVIAGERASGKTERCIEIANENDMILAVHSHEQRKRIEERCDNNPFIYDEVYNKRHIGVGNDILIDNLGLFLKSMVGLEVEGFSVSSDQIEVMDEDGVEVKVPFPMAGGVCWGQISIEIPDVYELTYEELNEILREQQEAITKITEAVCQEAELKSS
ncbi:MAG: hypothetical protein ABEH81_01270 [Halopenitus sp.]